MKFKVNLTMADFTSKVQRERVIKDTIEAIDRLAASCKFNEKYHRAIQRYLTIFPNANVILKVQELDRNISVEF